MSPNHFYLFFIMLLFTGTAILFNFSGKVEFKLNLIDEKLYIYLFIIIIES